MERNEKGHQWIQTIAAVITTTFAILGFFGILSWADLIDFEIRDPYPPEVALQPATKLQRITFNVDAELPWQNTNIYVQSGAEVTVRYISGKWTGGGGSTHGPDAGVLSSNNNSCLPYPSEGASLVGRIGNGTIFKVGANYSAQAQQDGYLLLRINDCDEWLGDNSGIITVEIETTN